MKVAELGGLAVKFSEAIRKNVFMESEKIYQVTPFRTHRRRSMAHPPLLSLWSFVAWWIHSYNTQTHSLDEDALPGWLCSGMTLSGIIKHLKEMLEILSLSRHCFCLSYSMLK